MTTLAKLIRAANGDPEILMSDFSSNELESALTTHLDIEYPTVAQEVRDELEARTQ